MRISSQADIILQLSMIGKTMNRSKAISVRTENKMDDRRRRIEIGVLVLCVFSTQTFAANVIEFYNTNLDHYFITSDANEAAAIDSGAAGAGWSRTGNTFKAGGNTSVCRFYGSQSPGPNSHFYTVDSAECQWLKDQQIPTGDPRKLTIKSWNFESLDFASTPTTNQACPSGFSPVYRAYNNGAARGDDSNHRITANVASIQQVAARGWSIEGAVMCAQTISNAQTPVVSGSQRACATSAATNYDQIITLGDYRLTTNAWGKGTIANFVDCIQGSRLGTTVQTGVQATLEWDWPSDPGFSVKSYQEIMYRPGGHALQPIAFANVGNLAVIHDYTAVATGNFNVAYDLWADSISVVDRWPHDAEIMIKTQGTWTDGPVVDTATFNGNVYDVIVNNMVQTSGSWKFVVFQSRTPLSSAILPIKPFIDYIITKGILPQSYFISTIEFGTEVIDGVGTNTINAYSVVR